MVFVQLINDCVRGCINPTSLSLTDYRPLPWEYKMFWSYKMMINIIQSVLQTLIMILEMSYPGGYYLHVSLSFVIICRKLELGHCEWRWMYFVTWQQSGKMGLNYFVSLCPSMWPGSYPRVLPFSSVHSIFLPYRCTKNKKI